MYKANQSGLSFVEYMRMLAFVDTKSVRNLPKLSRQTEEDVMRSMEAYKKVII